MRIGEVWRRVVAKHSLHANRATIQAKMLAARQYGVCIPGGADTLVHVRQTIEAVILDSLEAGAWAMADLDYENAFPSLEWDPVDAAVREEVEPLANWTEWCHSEPVPVYLPSGAVVWSDCGAEQGDPHGSVQCALTLAGVASRTRAGIIEARARAGPTAGAPVASGGGDFAAPKVPGLRPVPGYFDAWFADDGQLVCRPHDLDAVLRRMDAEAHKVGATRGAGPDVKSEVKIVAHPTAFAALRDDWVTEYIRETCVLKPANAGSEVLGVCIGSDAMRQTQVTEVMMKI